MFVSDLTGDKATIVVRKWIPGEGSAERADERAAHRARRAARGREPHEPAPPRDDLDFILAPSRPEEEARRRGSGAAGARA